MKMYASNNKSNNPLSLPRELREALEQEPEQLGQELEQVWNLTGISMQKNSASSEREVDAMWAQLQSRVYEKEDHGSVSFKHKKLEADRSPRKRQLTSVRVKARWAVSALMILVFAGLYWYSPVTVSSDRGEIARAVLPDGSIVQLNSGSSITYRRGFNGIPFVNNSSRPVKLNGEAFFDVAHSDLVFSVETFNAQVEVLGTEFNIRAWSNDPEKESTISLVSGKVAVSRADNAEANVILAEPGETVIVRNEEPVPDQSEILELGSVLSWQDRGISIKSKTLVTVFNELERRYDIQITVEDAQILNDSLTLLMAKPSNVESILSDICIEKNLKFRKTSRGYVIYRPDL